jgi:carboxymethylenebutenolidase
MQKLDWNETMLDVEAAVNQAASAGKVATIGYCWGGTASWLSAARVDGLAAAVVYYPGGLASFTDDSPHCATLCHFGEQDKSPSPEVAREVLAKYPAVTGYFYAAGHAFNNDQRTSYVPAAAALARSRTLAFLHQHLG